jgi:hypothetical protein
MNEQQFSGADTRYNFSGEVDCRFTEENASNQQI